MDVHRTKFENVDQKMNSTHEGNRAEGMPDSHKSTAMQNSMRYVRGLKGNSARQEEQYHDTGKITMLIES